MIDIYERFEKEVNIFQSKWCDCCAFSDLLEIVKRK